MIITTWIMYILARKSIGLPFPPRVNSDIEVEETEAVSVVQHWLNKTEEEASRSIKEKISINDPCTQGHDIHVTRDLVKHRLSKCDMLTDPNQEVLEERTRIQFIRWSHTRIFQVPSEMMDDVIQERIDQVRRSVSHLRCDSSSDPCYRNSCSEC
ncbi:spermatogenic specific-gene1 [Rattus norvegicus]|uniref:Spermatogenesis-associated protein 19, mitochondrial n=2 Tax=Rattus norvegicus TaxID=10116 RepID=SPT19_RAT|nr:spermatogenesis-associated protein 19, mitochondrial precursor [Rattus norvegicus]Q920Q3.1 RecName: Full=Spermatogenesis-associated protein 19, mitochondrial; AltName: Full=Spermatogenic cell-specific gene 1 protein; Short=Spergen-1; Flags: Precursor [Rattus norvegicus]AAH81729.1 Spermatogenesis associated 19 [Rattus norvegicus]EDL83332.1 spermatogenic specific-gene1 [Rattus norvegicus]BAB69061.1 spergen-1 [Rattus norvegicus]|eukprot:NP_599211.1 spermatogenesis-associated protein 19, mitochondrial precursor [Rattus norvegicus]